MRNFKNSKLLKAAPQIRTDSAEYQEARDIAKALRMRLDAGETAAFARQLQYVKQQTYDVRYPNLKARSFIPVDSSVPSGAEAFVWRAWDWAGSAKVLANFADDLPMVEVMGAEVVQGMKSLGDAYAYTLQDVRASQMSGNQLDIKRPQAARRAIENAIELIAATGNSAANLPGMLNNSNVPILTAGVGITGAWASATPAQMLADLHTLANSIVTTTKTVHAPNTIILPVAAYQLVATTVMNNITSDTVLTVFLKNSPYIRNVDQWVHNDTAGAAGVTRAVAYDRNPEVLELVISQEFEQLPPQAKGLRFEVPCHARVGGVRVSYPLAMVYGDGV